MLGFLCTRLQSVRGFDTSRLGQTSTHMCFSSLRFFRLFSDEDCLTGLTYQRCRTLRSHYWDITVKGYGHGHLLVCKDFYMRYCIQTVTVLSVVDRIE